MIGSREEGTKGQRDKGTKGRNAARACRKDISSTPFVPFLLAIVICGSLRAAPTTAPAFAEALHAREWSFPKDHGRHDGYKIEWWYFTGNLRDGTGRTFGYQLTFFRTAFAARPAARPSPWAMKDLYFAHAAVSDVAGKSFIFRDRLERGRAGLAAAAEDKLDVVLLDWTARQDEAGVIHLHANDEGMALDLACAPGRGPVLQGPGGVNSKGRGPGQASYYYSMTRLPTSGEVTLAGKVFHISGWTWMDHEFSSNALAPNQVGWDWMGLSLDSGDDLMIYRLRHTSGASDYLSGTRITADGQPHYLTAADITLGGSAPWKSNATGGAYPQEWKLQVKGLAALTVRSRFGGQELVTPNSTNVSYFEGTAQVQDERGKTVGEGYLEMTGYAKPVGAGGS